MFDPLSLHRLARSRHLEMLAEAEKDRQLRQLASPDNIRAVRKPYALANWFEVLHKQLIARFNN